VATLHIARFNVQQFHNLPNQCIYVLCMDLITKVIISLCNIKWTVYLTQTVCNTVFKGTWQADTSCGTVLHLLWHNAIQIDELIPMFEDYMTLKMEAAGIHLCHYYSKQWEPQTSNMASLTLNGGIKQLYEEARSRERPISFHEMSFNNAASYYSYRVLTINESMSMEQWWHDTDRSKVKYCDKILSQCDFVYHKSHVDWPGMKLASPQWQGICRSGWYLHSFLTSALDAKEWSPDTLL